jgi:hypothetical protein
VNPLAGRICETITDELQLIDKLKELSLSFKDVIVKRDLNALEANNQKKKTMLISMVSLQRAKDSLISDLAVDLGLDKDSSVNDILKSKKLDDDSYKNLSYGYFQLQKEISELQKLNSQVAVMLLASYRLNKAAIDMFTIHGTVDSTYSKDVKINASKKHSKVNKKI